MSATDASTFYGLIKQLTAEYDRAQRHNVTLSTENEHLRATIASFHSQPDQEEQVVVPNSGTQFCHDVPSTDSKDEDDEQNKLTILSLIDIVHEVRPSTEVVGADPQNLSATVESRFVSAAADTEAGAAADTEAGTEVPPPRLTQRSRRMTQGSPYRPRHVFQQRADPLSAKNRGPKASEICDKGQEYLVAANAHYLNQFSESSCLFHPSSKTRVFWGVAGITFLMLDVIFIPVDLCFSLTETREISSVQLASRIFWSVDIIMTFATGVFCDGRLVMDPKTVAQIYVRSWFLFDILLSTIDWGVMILSASSSPVSVLRSARGSRLVRCFRVLRLIKFQRIQPILRAIMIVSTEGKNALMQAVSGTALLIFALHNCTCLWHLLGSSVHDGWVSASGLDHVTVQRRYVCSLSWILMRGAGGGTKISINTTVEYWVDICIYLLSLTYFAGIIGLWTNTVITWSRSNVCQMYGFARQFIRGHDITWETAQRIELCLSTLQYGGVSEIVAHETKLKSVLPVMLENDVNYEIRWPVLSTFLFLNDVYAYNSRCIHRMCHSAVSEQIGIKKETIFRVGDACRVMYLVYVGEFGYEPEDSDTIVKTTGAVRIENTRCLPTENNILSQAALWTHWEHCGKLTSLQDSLLLNISAEKFSEVVTDYMAPKMHAIRYAEHFCWRLNRTSSPPSDVTKFELPPHVLDVELHIGGYEDHFAFISHFKLEAGTEATLMRDDMEKMIRDNETCAVAWFRHPVFVDTDNLMDLRRIADHVKGSLTLIVLLTPGLLTRPWCLLEIVTAKRYGRPIIPVLLDRPDVSYKFPDEEFYRKLHCDEVIDRGLHGRLMLEDNGISLPEVEESIRAMFNIIALPFSPHATITVRHAQVDDILKRCMRVTEDALGELEMQINSTMRERESQFSSEFWTSG